MKNEETIVTIAETTCGGNIYFYNCYDIWITKWGIADILNQSEAASVWFFSGILLIIMGMYVNKPYFSCHRKFRAISSI